MDVDPPGSFKMARVSDAADVKDSASRTAVTTQIAAAPMTRIDREEGEVTDDDVVAIPPPPQNLNQDRPRHPNMGKARNYRDRDALSQGPPPPPPSFPPYAVPSPSATSSRHTTSRNHFATLGSSSHSRPRDTDAGLPWDGVVPEQPRAEEPIAGSSKTVSTSNGRSRGSQRQHQEAYAERINQSGGFFNFDLLVMNPSVSCFASIEVCDSLSIGDESAAGGTAKAMEWARAQLGTNKNCKSPLPFSRTSSAWSSSSCLIPHSGPSRPS